MLVGTARLHHAIPGSYERAKCVCRRWVLSVQDRVFSGRIAPRATPDRHVSRPILDRTSWTPEPRRERPLGGRGDGFARRGRVVHVSVPSLSQPGTADGPAAQNAAPWDARLILVSRCVCPSCARPPGAASRERTARWRRSGDPREGVQDRGSERAGGSSPSWSLL